MVQTKKETFNHKGATRSTFALHDLPGTIIDYSQRMYVAILAYVHLRVFFCG